MDMLYVGLQDDDKIAVFALDGESGALAKRADVPAGGGPSVMAISPARSTLYVAHRERPSIASYRIDPASGGIALSGTAATESQYTRCRGRNAAKGRGSAGLRNGRPNQRRPRRHQ
jgi:6-phosphogluconolactonase (cycloisomerase 2 family)